jgi:hypothetical protein
MRIHNFKIGKLWRDLCKKTACERRLGRGGWISKDSEGIEAIKSEGRTSSDS